MSIEWQTSIEAAHQRIAELEAMCDAMAARRPVTDAEFEKWAGVAEQAKARIAELEERLRKAEKGGWRPQGATGSDVNGITPRETGADVEAET